MTFPQNGEHRKTMQWGTAASAASLEELESMSKEELIRELIKARINEARLKKGYEVKGDGTVILYGKENTR